MNGPLSAVPQRWAVGCQGRVSVVATVHDRCVGLCPLVAWWVPLAPVRALACASSKWPLAAHGRVGVTKNFRGRDAAKVATLPLDDSKCRVGGR